MAPTTNNVWTAMKYTAPQGPCNLKTSLMSPACSCLRFMLHPVKAISSFECDGCGHHASFHALENPAEEAVLKKWSDAASNQDPAPPRKKLKLLANNPESDTRDNRQDTSVVPAGYDET